MSDEVYFPGLRPHLLAHFLRGAFREGERCPGCRSHFYALLSLDLRDPRIRFPETGIKNVVIVTCFQCKLSHFDFAYRLAPGKGIVVLDALRRSRKLADNERYPFRRRQRIGLRKVAP